MWNIFLTRIKKISFKDLFTGSRIYCIACCVILITTCCGLTCTQHLNSAKKTTEVLGCIFFAQCSTRTFIINAGNLKCTIIFIIAVFEKTLHLIPAFSLLLMSLFVYRSVALKRNEVLAVLQF